jgi:hypothetical protein
MLIVLRPLIGVAATTAFCLVSANASADDQEQQQILQLQAELKQSQAEMQAALAQIQAIEHKLDALATVQTPVSPAPVSAHLDANGHSFLELKDGPGLSFYVPHGEIRLYGNLDVSVDEVAKNVGSMPANYAASPPVGNWGWMPDISTNLAYLGTRGFQNLGADTSFQFIYQFEAGFDVSATPGLKDTNSAQSNTVNGTLFNRNTFVGFSSPQYGAIKVGKTDAPYKQSTVSLNPFLGELGDNGAIMGNTGGDSRVEFGTRLDHSIWYESPQVHGFALSLLFSPGQNRDDLNGDIAAGESDCTGGNIPESGGDQPVLCNDGA